MYNQKVIFNELECKQILSEFVGNDHVAYKIRYDGVFYEKGCSNGEIYKIAKNRVKDL